MSFPKLAEILNPQIYKDPRLKPALLQLRAWMGPERGSRPEGYLNLDQYFYAYIAYYLPLHLPEVYWISQQLARKGFPLGAKAVLDVGCGPGTLTLSYLLWQQSCSAAAPEKIVLWDHSPKALATAKEKVLKLCTDATKVFTEKVKLPAFSRKDETFDLIVVGHFLTEWGSGPRFRDKKLSFLNSLVKSKLAPGGTLIVVEPPLREPTLDLMFLRDRLAATMTMLAPCPQSDKGCPMLKDHSGWCYAQPPREEFRAAGLAPYDKEIERLLNIQLTHPGFSYFAATAQKIAPPQTHIMVSENRRPRDLSCEPDGKIVTTDVVSAYRGQIITGN